MRWTVRAVALVSLGIFALSIPVQADEKPVDFSGTWSTTFSTLTLTQTKSDVTGKYGRGGDYSMKGKVEGRKLVATYREGNVDGEVTYEMAESGNAFTGTFRIPSNGRKGEWNGWRQDPKSTDGPPQSFAGLWLTRLGMTELTQTGAKVTGTWSFRGPMKIQGDVQGRRLSFRYSGPFSGKGWVELAKDKKSFAGAINDDKSPGWGGFIGRLATSYARKVKPKPGEIVDGVTSGMMTYSLRVPPGWTPGKPSTAILLLHGSNMSAKAYVNTLAHTWPDLAKDFVIVGIDGENFVDTSKLDEPAFNYSYVDFVGKSTFKGFPGTDRESPALVTEAMDEISKDLGIKKVLVGGHSQGGFLTYSLFMNYPEKYAGAFPISCGLIFQCEPSAYDDAAVRAAQRRVPLAIVHARNDDVVNFEMGQYAFDAFSEAGFPAIRFFISPRAQHMFGILPVAEAIRWLDALSSDDPEVLSTFAEKQAEAAQWRDVVAAVLRWKAVGKGKPAPRLAALEAKVAAAAKPGVTSLLPALEKHADASWLEEFVLFRDEFEFADAAKPVMDAFAKLRAAHQSHADEKMKEAQTAFNEGRPDDGYAAYQKIVDKYFASTHYRSAKKALAERK